MRAFKGKERLVLTVTCLLILIAGGCATAIKYSYDTKASFSEGKGYTWAQSSGTSRRDPLLESNVRALADQILAEKGFTRVSEKPDLMISISYEFDISGSYQYSYQLQMRTLNIYKVRGDMSLPADMPKMEMRSEGFGENNELIWRGTAVGTINIDAASGDLKQAVQGILLNFPPK